MGETADRAKGIVDETVGKAKRAIGDAAGNENIKESGDRQEAKGDLEKERARAEADQK